MGLEWAAALSPVAGSVVGSYLTSKSNDRATDKNVAILELKETVCGKRKERRQLLFRQGHAGRGVAGPIEKLKTALSKVRC